MKKRILCLFLVICLVLSTLLLVACDNGEGDGDGEGGPAVNTGDKRGTVHTTTDTSANVDPAIDRPSQGNDTLPQ